MRSKEKVKPDPTGRHTLLARMHIILLYVMIGCAAWALYRADYLRIPEIVSLPFLGVSFILLFCGFSVHAYSFRALLRAANIRVSFGETFASMGLNVFGKYVPGKVAASVGNALYLGNRHGIATIGLVGYGLQFMLISIVCGFVVGIPSVFLLSSEAIRPVLIGAAVVVVGAIGSVLLGSRPVLRWIQRRSGYDIQLVGIRALLGVAPWFAATWVFWGLGFWALGRSILQEPVSVGSMSIFPAAGAVGILSVFAPGGIGIREGISVGMLSSAGCAMRDAITLATASRLWFMVGEGWAFLGGLVVDRTLLKRNPR